MNAAQSGAGMGHDTNPLRAQEREGGNTQVKAEDNTPKVIENVDHAAAEAPGAHADGAPGTSPEREVQRFVEDAAHHGVQVDGGGALPPSAREAHSTAPGQSGWNSGPAVVPDPNGANPSGAHVHSLAELSDRLPVNAHLMRDAMDHCLGAMQQQVRKILPREGAASAPPRPSIPRVSPAPARTLIRLCLCSRECSNSPRTSSRSRAK